MLLNFGLIQALFIVLGALGIWLFLSSATGLLVGIFPSLAKRGDLLEQQSKRYEDETQDWPLPARIMATFSKIQRSSADEPALEKRIAQAGFPFAGPVEFYARQFTLMVIGAAFGILYSLMMSLIIPIPAIIILLIAFGTGAISMGLPARSLKKKLEDRETELFIDMRYSLPRLNLLLEAYGELPKTIQHLVEGSRRTNISVDERRSKQQKADEKSREFSSALGGAMTGFGGRLFAEALNRMALALTQGKSPEEMAEHVTSFYPEIPQFINFLDIVVAGLRGRLAMLARLQEMADSLRDEQKQVLREQLGKGKFAISFATIAAVFITLAMFLYPAVILAIGAIN